MAIAASLTLGGYLETITSGSYSSGGKTPFFYTGYADATATGTAFGSISPASANGITIKGIYHTTLSSTVVVMLAGNVTTAFSQIQIAGTVYSLGTGSYNSSGGYTTFNTPTIGTTPFTGTVQVYLR